MSDDQVLLLGRIVEKYDETARVLFKSGHEKIVYLKDIEDGEKLMQDISDVQAKAGSAMLKAEAYVQKYKASAPLCAKHEGGARNGCLVCGLIELSHALSKIDYAMSTPNEMMVSEYDINPDPNMVVDKVINLVQELAAIRAKASEERAS